MRQWWNNVTDTVTDPLVFTPLCLVLFIVVMHYYWKYWNGRDD